MIRAVPDIARMAPYPLASDMPPDAISLAQNEAAFPPSPLALAAGRAALVQAHAYPDPDWNELRSAIASIFRVSVEQILCGAGSMELIGCLIRAFAGRGDEVIGSNFGYLFVATACEQAGASYRCVDEVDYCVQVQAMAQAVTPETRMVFLCNPGNPTGTNIANSDIVWLRDSLPDDILLVIDQAYAEFDEQDPKAVFELVARGNCVVLRTFSKAYALASVRAGWGLFPPAVAEEIRKLLNPNNISIVSQAMAVAAMRDQAHMLDIVRRTARIRDQCRERLLRAGYPIPQSHTNFLLIPFASPDAARLGDQALREAGFLLRGMSGYGLAHCLRATIIAQEPMERMTDILVAVKGAEG